MTKAKGFPDANNNACRAITNDETSAPELTPLRLRCIAQAPAEIIRLLAQAIAARISQKNKSSALVGCAAK